MGERAAIQVVSAEICTGGRYLITQRSANAVLPNLWEFPGGRVRDGEDAAITLQRCLRERLGVEIRVGAALMSVTHEYEGYDLTLTVHRVTVVEGEPTAVAVQDVAWVHPDDFANYPFPGADQKTVDALITEG